MSGWRKEKTIPDQRCRSKQHDQIMKRLRIAILAGAVCAGLAGAAIAEPKLKAGPRGGRLLEKTNPEAEFFVEKNRTISIMFYDSGGKPVPAAGQEAVAIVDVSGEKRKIEFEAKDMTLVSKAPLPEGEGHNVVVQLKQAPDAKPQNFRFKLDTSICGGCHRAEYACNCHD